MNNCPKCGAPEDNWGRLKYLCGSRGIGYGFNQTIHCYNTMIGNENVLLKQQLATLREKLRWIPVEERLPDRCGDFEVKGEPAGYFEIAYFSLTYPQLELEILTKATHWREIPEDNFSELDKQ